MFSDEASSIDLFGSGSAAVLFTGFEICFQVLSYIAILVGENKTKSNVNKQVASK